MGGLKPSPSRCPTTGGFSPAPLFDAKMLALQSQIAAVPPARTRIPAKVMYPLGAGGIVGKIGAVFTGKVGKTRPGVGVASK